MQVDFVIIPMTKLYLRIIFSGLIFTFMYNCFASTLRALGDSKSPLYFLIISSVVNVFGDLIFVLIFHMGSEGCAISTVLSEAISCILCIIYIQKEVPILRLGKKWLIFDPSLLKQTIAYGWASAMQQATIQLWSVVLWICRFVWYLRLFLCFIFPCRSKHCHFLILPGGLECF